MNDEPLDEARARDARLLHPVTKRRALYGVAFALGVGLTSMLPDGANSFGLVLIGSMVVLLAESLDRTLGGVGNNG